MPMVKATDFSGGVGLRAAIACRKAPTESPIEARASAMRVQMDLGREAGLSRS
jgi:hypothetical protein